MKKLLRKTTTRKPTRRRSNPGDETSEAAALYERFHGKPASSAHEYNQPDEDLVLAELGNLVQLIVDTPAGEVSLDFLRGTKVASSPNGKQLYFVGGDQTVDLDEVGLSDQEGRDHIEIGLVQTIVYHTRKGFHNFEPVDYVHEFGEEGGDEPLLCYDAVSRGLFLVGGSYEVRPEGIVD